MQQRWLAPAKINLNLRVGKARGDGFHPILSWMCAVGLFDTLTIAPSDEEGIHLACDDSALACDGTNLVVRAGEAVLAHMKERQGEKFGKRVIGASAALRKRIPVGAGLGGGSSDGACALMAFNALFGAGLSMAELTRMAATLGSDVPFFLMGGSCICEGRGEVVTPIAPPRPRFALLIHPEESIPTAAVYRQFDRRAAEVREGAGRENAPREGAGAVGVGREGAGLEGVTVSGLDSCGDAGVGPFPRTGSVNPAAIGDGWTQLDAMELMGLLANDLEPAAFDLFPNVGRLRSESERILERPVRMSGSGSTFFTLFDAPAEAQAALLRQRLPVRANCVHLAVSAEKRAETAPGEGG